MLFRQRDSVSVSSKLYRPTEKEFEVGAFSEGASYVSSDDAKFVYWQLADRVREIFGDEGATIHDIYRQVTAPLGLSQSETMNVVRNAKKEGYLK